MAEIEKTIAAGNMTENPFKNIKVGDMSKENYSTDNIDLHRPYVDSIVLTSSTGAPMKRESDLIDVWFDSGAMPYAQIHYPFENSGADFKEVFPADFIAEGVDQTRGWFFTLHAIATMRRQRQQQRPSIFISLSSSRIVVRYSRLRSIPTTIHTAGVLISLCCTILSTHGLFAPQHFASA